MPDEYDPSEYEPGMSVGYDPVTHAVRVLFRGREYGLAGPYATSSAGFRAGEQFCRELGWQPGTSD